MSAPKKARNEMSAIAKADLKLIGKPESNWKLESFSVRTIRTKKDIVVQTLDNGTTKLVQEEREVDSWKQVDSTFTGSLVIEIMKDLDISSLVVRHIGPQKKQTMKIEWPISEANHPVTIFERQGRDAALARVMDGKVEQFVVRFSPRQYKNKLITRDNFMHNVLDFPGVLLDSDTLGSSMEASPADYASQSNEAFDILNTSTEPMDVSEKIDAETQTEPVNPLGHYFQVNVDIATPTPGHCQTIPGDFIKAAFEKTLEDPLFLRMLAAIDKLVTDDTLNTIRSKMSQL